MKLLFVGTRGEIDARTPRHQWHSALLITRNRRRVMIDCGADWLGRFQALRPHAIVLTHAHPDHAWGLKEGADCPVYATAETWRLIEDYPIAQRMQVQTRQPLTIETMRFEAFPVEHSIRCPAVSYRITAGTVAIHYAPDVVYITDRREALRDVNIYIGDGASMSRPLVRKRGNALIGHAAVRTQLTWCEKENVPRAIFTHCGSQIVTGNEQQLQAQLRQWASDKGVRAEIAHDAMAVTLRRA